MCGVCVRSWRWGLRPTLSRSRLDREHWGQTVVCGAQERRWGSTRTSWGWRPGYVFAGARGRRWVGTCRAGSRPPWWTRGWNPTRGLVETPWDTRKRASRGRRLARSAAGARGLPAAARLVCARPARSVAVGASWLCRERPGPVTAERLVRSTLAVIAAGASPAADCRHAGTSAPVCRTARGPARPRMRPCLALRHRHRIYDVNQRHW